MPESPPDPKEFLDSLLAAARRAAQKEVEPLRAEIATLRKRVDELETLALERMEGQR